MVAGLGAVKGTPRKLLGCFRPFEDIPFFEFKRGWYVDSLEALLQLFL